MERNLLIELLHFRYEGTKRDRVMALPSHLETTSLRLYLLNI